MTVSLDRKIESLELPFRSEWPTVDIAEHHRLTHKLITQIGSYTDIDDRMDNCPSPQARKRRERGQAFNYNTGARDKSIRFDYIYRGLDIPELVAKWKLSRPQVYRALGNMKVANNRRAHWKYSNRRA